MKFVIFTVATGEIVAHGSCTFLEDVEVPVGAAILGVEEIVTPLTHYISDGVPTAYTEEQRQAKGVSTNSYRVWDNTTMTRVDTRSLAELKTAKHAEINAARFAADRSTFSHGGKTFSCDEASRSYIIEVGTLVALTGSLPAGWTGAWKAVDDTYLSIPDVEAWTSFYRAMVDQSTANFVWAQALKAQLEVADRAGIDAVVW